MGTSIDVGTIKDWSQNDLARVIRREINRAKKKDDTQPYIWQPLAQYLSGTWTNSLGARIKKDADGRVWLRGEVINTAGYGYPSTIATLPREYWPRDVSHQFMIPGFENSSGGVNTRLISMSTAGLLRITGTINGATDTGSANNYLMLYDVNWDTAI